MIASSGVRRREVTRSVGHQWPASGPPTIHGTAGRGGCGIDRIGSDYLRPSSVCTEKNFEEGDPDWRASYPTPSMSPKLRSSGALSWPTCTWPALLQKPPHTPGAAQIGRPLFSHRGDLFTPLCTESSTTDFEFCSLFVLVQYPVNSTGGISLNYAVPSLVAPRFRAQLRLTDISSERSLRRRHA